MGIIQSPRMLVTDNKRAFSSRKATTSSTNETVVASNINRTSRYKKYYDEASILSDHSSLGSRMQMPHAFRLHDISKLSKTPQQVFPSSSRSSTSSREMLRQEAKVQRLVLQAKQSRPTQEHSARMRQMQDPIFVQSMSVTLPAACYHHTKNKSSKTCSHLPSKTFFFFNKGLDTSSGWKQTTNDLQSKPWISSAANSFVREEQKRRRHGDAGNTQNISGSNLVALPEEEESEGQSPRKWGWKAYCRLLPRHYSPIANRRNKAQAF